VTSPRMCEASPEMNSPSGNALTPTTPSSSSPSSRKKWNWNDYAHASAAGVARGLAGFPLEHPFDLVKTRLQAQPQVSLSGMRTARDIYRKDGFTGFYTGGMPNATRAAVKQAYRYPLMFALPRAFESILPPDVDRKNPAVKKALTGVTIAGLETYVLTPLERLKVYLMTAESNKSHLLLKFFQENKNKVRKELFRGLNALMPKQMVSWTTFLVADDKIKRSVHGWTGVPQKEELPFVPLMLAGTAVGVVNSAASLPFDCVKTHLQMYNHMETPTLRSAFQSIYQQSGVMGFYRGWQTRMTQYILHSVFTVTIMERLEKQ